MNYTVMHCPDKGLHQFEEISHLIKNKDNVDMGEFLRVTEKWVYNQPGSHHVEATEAFLNQAKQFFMVRLYKHLTYLINV